MASMQTGASNDRPQLSLSTRRPQSQTNPAKAWLLHGRPNDCALPVRSLSGSCRVSPPILRQYALPARLLR
jgi:hypothetical protein